MGIDSRGNNGHSHSHIGCFPFLPIPIPNFVTNSQSHGNPMGFSFMGKICLSHSQFLSYSQFVTRRSTGVAEIPPLALFLRFDTNNKVITDYLQSIYTTQALHSTRQKTSKPEPNKPKRKRLARTRYLYFPRDSRSATSAWSADSKKRPKNRRPSHGAGKWAAAQFRHNSPDPAVGTRPRGRLDYTITNTVRT